MNPSRTRSRSSLVMVVALVCCAMAVVIYEEASDLSEHLAAPAAQLTPPAPEKSASSVPANFQMPPAGDFAEVLARPLFSSTRRPQAETAQSSAAVAASASFTLIGTIISQQGHYALLKSGQSARLQRVTEGQEIEGWTVDRIFLDRVMLRNASGQAEVKLKDQDRGPARNPAIPEADTSPKQSAAR